eukprot:gnl/Chilomastix_cuspidata/8496.p4 GENE.gnl/Chilomastix_cuspidata/8496~~gnl/Chilomastix_cuspidata/8496.p4  ORF type:complete len:109 (-),score=6.19 gnl/Chilomastix_cuspidata/8496:288-614(-)
MKPPDLNVALSFPENECPSAAGEQITEKFRPCMGGIRKCLSDTENGGGVARTKTASLFPEFWIKMGFSALVPARTFPKLMRSGNVISGLSPVQMMGMTIRRESVLKMI